MAQLPPDGRWLMQQVGSEVILFDRHNDEHEIARFNPAVPLAVAQVQKVIYDSTELTDEQKSFAHFWAGYFYAYTSPAEARIDHAVQLISKHGDTDGAHHKQWVLNQVMRELTAGAFGLEDEGTAP
jgi:hypothetical protein